jgi:hypothetical protein
MKSSNVPRLTGYRPVDLVQPLLHRPRSASVRAPARALRDRGIRDRVARFATE